MAEMSNEFDMSVLDALSGRSGVGFKPQHVDAVLAGGHKVDWFEVHAENYMGAGGPPHARLEAVRSQYPLSIHGVGLSIGGAGGIDRRHLDRLKQVVDRYQPALVSEHIAWSTHQGRYFNDLLALPYTQETLMAVCEHVDAVQTRLGRQILIENPSTYVVFEESSYEESAFIGEVVRWTGCGLLLDVNNVFVSCVNHGWDAELYIDGLPAGSVGEVHLAGYAEDVDEDGHLTLIDAHDRGVSDDVWQLFEHAIQRTGPLPVLVEWDNDVPDWPVLADEAVCASSVVDRIVDRKADRRVA